MYGTVQPAYPRRSAEGVPGLSSTGITDQDFRRMMAIATYGGGTEGDGLPWEVDIGGGECRRCSSGGSPQPSSGRVARKT